MLNTINKFELIQKENKNLNEMGVNPTLYWAYNSSKEAQRDLIDFDDVIFENEIQQIVKEMKELGIERFTVSSGFSNLLQPIEQFIKQGCTLVGLAQVKERYRSFDNEVKTRPALEIKL